MVTFSGPLAGDNRCNITLREERANGSLYDVYGFVIGYDDLYRMNRGLREVGKYGAHFDIECRIKQSGFVAQFPFVQGTRAVVALVDGVATKFQMARCTSDDCVEVDDNSVTDISPSSTDDPMVWFKVYSKYVSFSC